MTVRDLKRSIDSESPRLNEAIFKPEAAGCPACQKNSDVQKKLFAIDEYKETRCLDADCYKQKTNNFLNGHWHETEYHEKHGTTGFRFIGNLNCANWEAINKRAYKKCKSCDRFVTLLFEGGDLRQGKACLDPKCYRETYEKKKAAGKNTSAGGESLNDGPRKPWHGDYFRQKFFQAKIPEKLNCLKTTVDTPDANEKVRRIALFTLLKSNSDLHRWFAQKAGMNADPDDHWFYISDEKLFEQLAVLDIGQLNELTKEALAITIVQSDYGPDGRRLVAEHIGIDLAKEWQPDEEYFAKKTKAEIIAMGEKFGIFQDDKAQAFLYETLGKKRRKFTTCKKPELVRVFLESGVDLTGCVPDEILHDST